MLAIECALKMERGPDENAKLPIPAYMCGVAHISKSFPTHIDT